tara:strand:- start:19 stop:618 length:600 start_codon:yes stop_codon:yes gene_type:complete
MKHILLSLLIAGLSACSSKPVDMNYYLLSPAQAVMPSNQINKTHQVKVNKIVLADYLKQSSIVMQINDNQMYFSRQNLWAESLENAISNALLRELNQSSTTQFNGHQIADNKSIRAVLTLHIEHFHATDKSTVISSGRYWLLEPNSQQTIEKTFYFSLPLEHDGFSHAISQQRLLLNLLAQDIQQQLDNVTKTTEKHAI